MSKSNDLKKQAIGLGLCAQWQGEWGNPTDAQLADKYIKGIDFAIKHDWPSVEYIKAHFDKVLLHDKGIWCDEPVTTPKRGIMVLNGHCTGVLNFSDWEVVSVYVRHDSNVLINVSKFARVAVSVYDGATVQVNGNGAHTAYVYPYGDDAQIIDSGNVIVRPRRNKLGD